MGTLIFKPFIKKLLRILLTKRGSQSMIVLIFFTFLASSHAAPQGMPSFKISGYSRSNVPEMSVTFDNGKTRELMLEPYSESGCNFIGEVKGEPGSSVAVTGCLNGPRDKMHITLLSDDNTLTYVYMMDFDGQVTSIEHPMKHQKGPNHPISTDRLAETVDNIDHGFHLHKDKMGDELVDDYVDKQIEAAAMKVPNWPEKLYAYIKLGYDNTIARKMEEEGTTFKEWVTDVMNHVQTHFRHKTLPVKIEFKYDHSETVHRDEDLPNTNYLNDWAIWALEDVKNNPKVNLYTVFGHDYNPVDTYVGLAGVETVCGEIRHKKGTRFCDPPEEGGRCEGPLWGATSFNEWSRTPAETALTVAHELGHNFGMWHDFNEKHGGDNGPCDGKGIMSYGDHPEVWSRCSVADFTKYYEYNDLGNTCLKDWGVYVPPCEDICPGDKCKLTYVHDGSKLVCENHIDECYRFEGSCDKTCGFCKVDDNNKVDGQWGEWSSWSTCTKTCGEGNSIKERKCNNPAPSGGGSNCIGDSEKRKDCNVESCPIDDDGQWSEWEAWSACTKTCGGGKSTRTRECNNRRSDCIGDSEQSEDCNVESCSGVTTCRRNSDCPNNQSCNDDGECQIDTTTCHSHMDCPFDQSCRNGECLCYSDYECPEDQTCNFDGKCQIDTDDNACEDIWPEVRCDRMWRRYRCNHYRMEEKCRKYCDLCD